MRASCPRGCVLPAAGEGRLWPGPSPGPFLTIVPRRAAAGLPQSHFCLHSALGSETLGTRRQGGWLSPICLSPLVMWCSAAMDVLFLIDGSHSIGKGSFERAKHFAITVCDALDINPERVSVFYCLCVRVFWVANDRNPSRGGNFLARGTGKTKGANPGSRHGGTHVLSPPFSPPQFLLVGFLPRQVFHTQQSHLVLFFKPVALVKRKWTSFPADLAQVVGRGCV